MPKKKPRLKLLEEEGSTDVSLDNARQLVAERGRPVKVVTGYRDGTDWSYLTVTTFADGFEHTFLGFAWGYGGVGPNGLYQFLTMSGLDIPFGRIVSMPQKARYEWMHGTVSGAG